MKTPQQTFIANCKQYLEQRWRALIESAQERPLMDVLQQEEHKRLLAYIRDSLTCRTKTYHYVLPTQLLAKCVNPELDSRSLQAAYGGPGAFDARTLAHSVIVPFDRTNDRVLGGSPEPYVNNPVRVPAVTPEYRTQQKAKKDWDKLVYVLETVENTQDETFTRLVFDQVLIEIYRLLSDVSVVYPTPSRIRLEQTRNLIRDFIGETSGGDRLETVCTALFRTIGRRFRLFDEVRRAKVNAPNGTSGMLADIECWRDERIVLLVEVKDRELTLIQIDTKLEHARAQRITEILFIAQAGIREETGEAIEKRIASEFTSGQNVYITDFFEFAEGILILLGEEGRVELLDEIGRELDRVQSDIHHRRRWAELLKGI
ncbi:MAG: restriction endonuclease, SacI family [Chloroflexi bacterium]|nr:restriction endonuclease, SacI family [Chloroflexota bacterium]